ncbi:hypothetical protein FisN_23Lu118 [Fistulifera solaris]|uniref:Uncharacterized protein n=1 Tax=Fistulifera solaris TaxID=1519565 RepID=A0A1Z5KJP3_FISSO|nr:hypothetical protein FisN_23Lu118 [Fistulifera solaris]|eukprot:GAX26534.1 hypothetical protein FisN_23Lu118 [Fistulifera solaris]
MIAGNESQQSTNGALTGLAPTAAITESLWCPAGKEPCFVDVDNAEMAAASCGDQSSKFTNLPFVRFSVNALVFISTNGQLHRATR